ncbi:HTH-type transcriptional regulator TrpI [Roseibium sp. TrichSKD4]|uniref:LysR family transcriptional regulator n=1 Tax=Roseibium sp. TrichSKD4 TaxID=744980 RepID=UPI0001E56B72|nr:LysR family transcriptional regulator [Roseibium sp. TrichSKD4]EFO30712.1 HTH-type transcriptional regulator TrpI [Roseibium sp. TrichSKD4]
MRQPITSLPSLNCFRAAASLESFSKAADALSLTHGAISRSVRLLEEDLGVALFERRSRRVFLTDDGRELLNAVEEGFGRIDQAIANIRSRLPTSRVVLSCEPTLLMRWLIPRVSAFSGLCPGFDLQLVAGGGPVNLGQGIDLAIRRNDFAIPDKLNQVPLFSEEVAPVCRSDLVDRFFERGQVRSDAPRLHTKSRSDAWATWSGMTGNPVSCQHGQVFEHFYFSLQAAFAGLGVALGPKRQVQDDINNGLLSAPLGFVKDGSEYVLLSIDRIESGSAQAKVRDWLMSVV